jgi:hypothetical protein
MRWPIISSMILGSLWRNMVMCVCNCRPILQNQAKTSRVQRYTAFAIWSEGCHPKWLPCVMDTSIFFLECCVHQELQVSGSSTRIRFNSTDHNLTSLDPSLDEKCSWILHHPRSDRFAWRCFRTIDRDVFIQFLHQQGVGLSNCHSKLWDQRESTLTSLMRNGTSHYN